MATEQFSNAPQTTLAVAMNSIVTTMTVAGATGFPTVPQFRIVVDQEIMLVTAVAGATWTVTRAPVSAQEGTLAAAHAVGATVSHILTAGGLSSVSNLINGLAVSGGTGATLTAAGQLAVGGLTVSSGSGPYTSTALAGGADFGAAVRIAGGKPWFDVTHPTYGAKGDGVTNDTVAIQAAITAASAANGGVVFFPVTSFQYLCSGQLVLDSMVDVSLVGQWAGNPGIGANPRPWLLYTGTAASFISARSTNGVTIRGLAITYNNAGFTGLLIDSSHSSAFDTNMLTIENCGFSSGGTGFTSAAACIGLDKTGNSSVRRCWIGGAQVGIRGAATNGSYSNVNTIDRCTFSSSTGTIAVAHIQNPNQGWYIINNDFEMGNAVGNCSVIGFTGTLTGLGIQFVGNWLGDMTAAAPITEINVVGSGWAILGNAIQGSSASTGVSIAANAIGVIVRGNYFNTHSVGIAYGATVNRVDVTGNAYATVTTTSTGTPTSGIAEDNLGSLIAYSTFTGNSFVGSNLRFRGNSGGQMVLDAVGTTGITHFFRSADGGTTLFQMDAGGHLFSSIVGAPVASTLGANVTSVTFTGNDRRGTIAIVMSAGLAANTKIATCTYAVSYGATAPFVFLPNQTSGVGLAAVNFYRLAVSTGVSFDLACNQALVAGTYTVGYVVEG